MCWYNRYASKIVAKFFSKQTPATIAKWSIFIMAPVFAGVPQGFVLDPLFFLIYINDLTKAISSTNKLFADGTSIFSIVNDIDVSEHELNSDLRKISMWAYQYKMSFNPYISKQAQEVIFSKRAQKLFHSTVLFNNIPVQHSTVQKHLGVYLDEKLNFNTHITEKIGNASKGIGVIKKLFKSLPRNALLTIYKSFVRPHLDYCDIAYDRPNNESFISKLEQVQYNAALAITGAIKCTSHSKLYNELGLESLESRRRLRRLCFLHKIISISNGLPAYLYKLIPKKSHQYITRNVSDIATYQCRTDAFKFSFFSWTINDWNKIDIKIRNSPYSVFRNYMLNEIRPKPSPLYNIHNPPGIKLLTRLRLVLSHLNQHKFNHNFDDCVNPFCTCSLEPESTSHFFLHCHHYNAIQSILFEDLNSIGKNLFKLSDNELTLILLYGSTKYSLMNNHILLHSSIKYIENSKRFSGSLF